VSDLAARSAVPGDFDSLESDRAQDSRAQLDWTGLDLAEAQLRAANAFDTSAEADASGVILRLPSER
jgi:hypothetical protein